MALWQHVCMTVTNFLFHIRDEVITKADEKQTLIYSDINMLLHTISMIINIVISMREHTPLV